MSKQKKALAALMCAVIIFAGCSTIHENNDISDIELPSPSYELPVGAMTRTITPSLYFFDSGYSRLSIETRELAVREDQTEAEVIIEALLSGPSGGSSRSLGSGLSLDFVEMTGELANVYILSDRTYNDERRFMISTAITDTVADYFGVSYVSVFINGEPLKINGYPCSVLKKSGSANVQDMYNEYLAKYSPQYYLDGEEHEITAVLYFPDETNSYILPEIRTVSMGFSEDIDEFRRNFALKLLEELAKGPKTRDNLSVCLDNLSVTDNKAIVEFDDAMKRIRLSFLRSPFISGSASGFDPVEASSVFYTIAGAMDGVIRMELNHIQKSISLSRALSKIYVGSVITLYMPKSSQNSLTAVSRTVYSAVSHQPDTYILELMRGPLETDSEELKSCFSQEMDYSMFISAEVKNGVAYVDFTSDFAKAARKMNGSDERMMFYSVINTLCSIPRIKSVQFLIDGEHVGDIGGEIHLEYPLLPNQGLLG